MTMAESIQVHGSWAQVDGDAWDELVGDASPFLEYTFLAGLEATGCAVTDTGWTPRVVMA